MRRVYWRPQSLPRKVMVLVAGISLLAMALVERATLNAAEPHYEDMLSASRRAREAFAAIGQLRAQKGIPYEPQLDPTRSGLIGHALTPVTSVAGNLRSKQTTINPNWAGVILLLLREAGVEQGDVVAVGFSGSFPALNASVCCALEVMGAKPLIMSSAAASQYGANDPELLWIDMERHLEREGLISFRSLGASLGGHEDAALSLSEEGRALLTRALERNELPLLAGRDLPARVRERIALYTERAEGRPIKAYINVGGGASSVGGPLFDHAFKPGLNRSASALPRGGESVMGHFAREGVPVLHLSNILTLAERFRMPVQPARLPAVGAGGLYSLPSYDRRLAAASLLVLLVALVAFARSGVLSNLISASAESQPARVQPML